MSRKIESIYADDDNAPQPAVIEALDKAAGGELVDVDGKRYMTDAVAEAVVQILPRDGGEILYVRVNDRDQWRPIARLQPRTVGSHRFIAGRPYLATLSARALAGCERASGRRDTGSHLDAVQVGEDEFRPVAVQAATSKSLTTGSRTIWVKYSNLWFPAGSFRRKPVAMSQDADMMAARRNFPSLATI